MITLEVLTGALRAGVIKPSVEHACQLVVCEISGKFFATDLKAEGRSVSNIPRTDIALAAYNALEAIHLEFPQRYACYEAVINDWWDGRLNLLQSFSTEELLAEISRRAVQNKERVSL